MVLLSRHLMLLLVVALSSSLVVQAQTAQRRSSEHTVVVNGERLTGDQLARLESRYGLRVASGTYWYDAASGAWGYAGGPTIGFVPAGLNVGGPLRADASGGTTGVFVNGRQLHVQDVAALQQLVGQVLPGRYWLDAYGNVGREGQAALLNLVALARQAQRRAGGNAFYRSGNTDIGAGSSGGTSYVMGEGWSVIVGN